MGFRLCTPITSQSFLSPSRGQIEYVRPITYSYGQEGFGMYIVLHSNKQHANRKDAPPNNSADKLCGESYCRRWFGIQPYGQCMPMLTVAQPLTERWVCCPSRNCCCAAANFRLCLKYEFLALCAARRPRTSGPIGLMQDCRTSLPVPMLPRAPALDHSC